MVLSEALFEPLDPARVEQIELEIVKLELRIGGELQEEGQPQISGCFARDIEAIDKPACLIEVKVEVITLDKGIAQKIADDTEIEHQSPQVILFHDGQAVWKSSHRAITAE